MITLPTDDKPALAALQQDGLSLQTPDALVATLALPPGWQSDWRALV